MAGDEFKSDTRSLLGDFDNETAEIILDQSLTASHPVKGTIKSVSFGSHIGRYRIEKELGEGGFGKVLLAVDEELQQKVAIKIARKEIDEEDTEAFLSEARLVATLDHPYIVPVYDVGRVLDGGIFIVAKFIDGNDLRSWLEGERPTFQQSAKLVLSLAQALAYAHGKGLVHRDIKPGNILMENTGQAFLCDFGLALREEQYGTGPNLAGTPAYMSPEQARGEGHRVDFRSDIYSLGVVLYELLTNRRPFKAELKQLLRMVAFEEPRMVREIDESIPMELERITKKCMEKRTSDRYSNAAELVIDLKAFLEGEPTDEKRRARVVPKGLRSFESSDRDFFFQLLAGARDRNGLPESIRFWKQKLEERDSELTFRVGLLYGPSGCGKSSMVKAGLLPCLADNVRTIFVEATSETTELSLLDGLRRVYPVLSSGISLKEAIAQIRLGQIGSSARKTVLIIDQFEQWLHAHNDYSNTELANALRQCDGNNVQTLLMVRDDFWLAVSRLFIDLDIRLLEGGNSRLVDIFDLTHARKVLFEFGRAFGRLPENPKDLDHEQSLFLDNAVAGLSIKNKLISVRLALFAEMVKEKVWAPSTLKNLGGISGVGVAFLEEIFNSPTASQGCRQHQPAARSVLRSLLPDEGTDIKGHSRSEDQLREDCGYENNERYFQDLLHILDNDLRLITPSGQVNAKSGNTLGSIKTYQLTHDYLVPSIRDWLNRKQLETRKGRAELKLEERASLWHAKPENRNLPSLFEWGNILTLTEKSKWSSEEREMMAKSAGMHSLRLVVAAMFVFVACAIVAFFVSQNRRTRTEAMVEAVLTAPPSAVPYAIGNLNAFPGHAIKILTSYFEDESRDATHRLQAAFALAYFERVEIEFLVESIGDAQVSQCKNFVTALNHSCEESMRELRKAVGSADVQKDFRRKARLAIVAMFLGDAKPAAEMLQVNNRPDPTQRTILIETLHSWHGNLNDFAKTAAEFEDASLRSGICLGLGGIDSASLTKKIKSDWATVLSVWYLNDPDGAIHSSANWALRKWGLELPELKEPNVTKAHQQWYANSIGMTLLKIPAGSFVRRDSEDEKNGIEQSVLITKPFWLADREVTRAQFELFMNDPKASKTRSRDPINLQFSSTEQHPMTEISWFDAILFANWLSRKEGLSPCYESRGKKIRFPGIKEEFQNWQLVPNADGYRLPTEAEWEYACKAGTTSFYSFGNDFTLLNRYAVYRQGHSDVPGSKLPNGWGLFDMHGNVLEWCEDRFKQYGMAGEIIDPRGPDQGTDRVLRGGAFSLFEIDAKSDFRDGDYPVYRVHYYGLRLARNCQ